MFEALALRPNLPLSAKDISRFSGVAWATTHRRLDEWEPRGVVVDSGRNGKAQLYRLNYGSPAIRALASAVSLAVSEIFATDLAGEGVREPEEIRVDQILDIVDRDAKDLNWTGPVNNYFEPTRQSVPSLSA